MCSCGMVIAWSSLYGAAEAQEFSKKFNEAMDINGELIGTPETAEATGAEESKAADDLAAAVKKVEVA